VLLNFKSFSWQRAWYPPYSKNPHHAALIRALKEIGFRSPPEIPSPVMVGTAARLKRFNQLDLKPSNFQLADQIPTAWWSRPLDKFKLLQHAYICRYRDVLLRRQYKELRSEHAHVITYDGARLPEVENNV